MSTRPTSTLGHLTLIVAHCAGMVDLVALPVWVGTLIQHHKLDPQQAGGLATLFLIGASLSKENLRSVGWRPFAMGIALWVVVSAVSLWAVQRAW